jgi:hypothetical protein
MRAITAHCSLLPGPPSFTKVGEINLTNVGKFQGWVGYLLRISAAYSWGWVGIWVRLGCCWLVGPCRAKHGLDFSNFAQQDLNMQLDSGFRAVFACWLHDFSESEFWISVHEKSSLLAAEF